MTNPPTPSQIWLEAWIVWEKDHWSWRAEKFTSPNGLHKQIDLWPTHYLFPGQSVIVSFYSRDTMTRESALVISTAVVQNRTRQVNISLKD